MKPFDLEAAKRGDPIVADVDQKILFIGLDSSGNVVAEDSDGWLVKYRPQNLFMAPKKRTVWVNLYQYFDTEEDADAAHTIADFQRIGCKAYPVEIEE